MCLVFTLNMTTNKCNDIKYFISHTILEIIKNYKGICLQYSAEHSEFLCVKWRALRIQNAFKCLEKNIQISFQSKKPKIAKSYFLIHLIEFKVVS